MKKLTTVLLTLAFVFGVAAMSSAACFNCAGDAGNINRGCEGVQAPCSPFDFENPNDYCGSKLDPNRAIFKICDCIPEVFDSLEAGDTVDISLEILVDSGDGPESGDNGVYWAENVGTLGVPMGTYEDQDDACDEYGYGSYFTGPYDYLLEDGEEGFVSTGTNCDLEDEERVVKIEADRAAASGNTGYTIQPGDDFDDKSTWAIDIPRMRVDNNLVEGGEKVWVKICLYRYTGGICAEDPCCCEIFIGELCCDTIRQNAGLIYPYFPPANSETWNLIGMTITNLDSEAGEAVVTVYESDGTVGTITVEVPANGIFLVTLEDLLADPDMVKTGTGDLGDSKCYITVMAEFEASGFAMIADTIDGASMGYLPQYGYGN